MLEINKIYCGDNIDYFKLIDDNSIDCIITDPPYIIDTNAGGEVEYIGASKRASKIKNTSKKYWEKKGFEDKARYNIEGMKNGFDVDYYLNEFERMLKMVNMFIFCSNKQISSLMRWGEERGYITTLLCWVKTNSTPFANGVWRSDVEFIVHIRQKGAIFNGDAELKKKAFISPSVISKYNHPTEKPIDLIKKFVLIGTNENNLILDPFIGSGTTAEVAINLNRNFIGIEIDECYYKIACKRIEMAKGNVGLFSREIERVLLS